MLGKHFGKASDSALQKLDVFRFQIAKHSSLIARLRLALTKVPQSVLASHQRA